MAAVVPRAISISDSALRRRYNFLFFIAVAGREGINGIRLCQPRDFSDLFGSMRADPAPKAARVVSNHRGFIGDPGRVLDSKPEGRYPVQASCVGFQQEIIGVE